nr:diguanylate cyclase [uncultured Roseateles sp.]
MNRPPTPTLQLRTWLGLTALAGLVLQGVLLVLVWPAGLLPSALMALALLLSLLSMALAVREMQRLRKRGKDLRRTLDEALEALPASVEIFDRDDRLMAYNRKLHEIYPHMQDAFRRGASFEALVRTSLAQGRIPAAFGREQEWLAERLQARKLQREPLLQKIHNDRWLRIYERHMPSGGVVGVRMDVTDLIQEQQRLEASQAHLQAFVRATPNGVLTLDTAGHVLELNPACERLFGYSAEEMQGSHINLLFGRELLRPGRALADTLGEPMEVNAQHRHGEAMTLQLSMAEVHTETTHRFVCILTDLSERKRQELALQEANAQLARQSTTDGLTGIGNRRLFDQSLQQEWQRSARHGQSLACLMVDIDHFKQFNDHYGHVAGDDCLRRVAELLRACAGRSGESVCRYGGEEFVILLAGCDLVQAQLVAQRCLDSLRLAAIEHAASPLRRSLSLSIGVAACVPEADQAAQSLVEQADAALYRAKQAGRARMAVQTQAAA